MEAWEFCENDAHDLVSSSATYHDGEWHFYKRCTRCPYGTMLTGADVVELLKQGVERMKEAA